MSLEVFLLLLRLVSASILLLLLATIFVILWRGFRSTVRQMEAEQVVYGQLVAVLEVDGSFKPTGDSYPLRPLTSLGRAPTNNVVVDDSFASSEHALIALRDGQWWLEDRNSRNGTTLNGILVDQRVVVTRGDIIGIGQKTFRFDLE